MTIPRKKNSRFDYGLRFWEQTSSLLGELEATQATNTGQQIINLRKRCWYWVDAYDSIDTLVTAGAFTWVAVADAIDVMYDIGALSAYSANIAALRNTHIGGTGGIVDLIDSNAGIILDTATSLDGQGVPQLTGALPAGIRTAFLAVVDAAVAEWD